MTKKEKEAKHPDTKNCGRPSRFPELFPHLAAEEDVANMLHHAVEDDVILGDHPEIPGFPETLGDGIRWCRVRYLDVLNKDRDNMPYDEWLIEPEDYPYWRIVFRTNIENEWPPTQIVSVYNSPYVWDFLRDRAATTNPNDFMPRPT